MTSDSRVEAVARALNDKLWDFAGLNFTDINPQALAQAAIEANDAWSAARPVWVCPNCSTKEHYPYPTECRGCGDFCPYSEEPDQ